MLTQVELLALFSSLNQPAGSATPLGLYLPGERPVMLMYWPGGVHPKDLETTVSSILMPMARTGGRDAVREQSYHRNGERIGTWSGTGPRGRRAGARGCG